MGNIPVVDGLEPLSTRKLAGVDDAVLSLSLLCAPPSTHQLTYYPPHPPLPTAEPYASAEALLQTYMDKDLEFIIMKKEFRDVFDDTEFKPHLDEACRDSLWKIFKMGPSGGDRVSAMDIICGFSCVCDASASEKLTVLFNAFDFMKRGKLNGDEVLVLFMSIVKGVKLVTGVVEDQTPEFLEKVVERFMNGRQEMTFEEFTDRVKAVVGKKRWAEDIPLRLLLSKFGIGQYDGKDEHEASGAEKGEEQEEQEGQAAAAAGESGQEEEDKKGGEGD